MYTYTWYQWVLFFFIYCFIGWIIESTFVSVRKKHFVNRGFLRLPLLPLYGSGAIIMLWVSLPFHDNLILVFLSGMVGASVLEYVTGYVMERLFKMKYWDYSNNPMNLNGYICLGTSIAWGFLTIALTVFIHRPVERIVLDLSPLVDIAAVCVIGILFIADTIQSTKEALDLGRALETMTKMKAELEEIQLQMALLKMDAAQKVSDLHDGAVSKAANWVGESTVKLTELKAENAMRYNDAVNAIKESAQRRSESVTALKEAIKRQAVSAGSLREAAGRVKPDLSSLSERLQTLTEKRTQLSHHLGFYRKGLLRGNPTATSKQFEDALKELKEFCDERQNSGKRS